jgi:O-antigen/teichoic acid export membrane protein
MLRILARNAGSNVSVMLVKMGFAFVMAPVIVRALGNYDYGLWEIVLSLVGYMGMLDMGMRPAVTRYVAKFNAEGNRSSLNELFSTTVAFNGIIGLLACSILIAWAAFNPEILAEHNTNTDRYVFFLLIIATQLLFQFPGYIAECFHMGHQRHFLKNNITIFNTIVGCSCILYLLSHGYGLITLALVNCIGVTLKYTIYFLLLFSKKYGEYRIKKKYFSLSILRVLLLFGGKSFVMGIAGTISGGISKVAIGFFLGPAAVPFYTIPARLISYISQFTMTVSNVFMPMFSHLQAKGEDEQLKNMYMVATKYIVGVTCPMAIGISLLGPYFISRWIGPEYAENCNYILYFLSIGSILCLGNPLFSRFMTGTGQVGFLAIIRSLGALLLLIITLLLIRPYGKEGVAFAYLATYCLVAPYEFWYATKQLKIKTFSFVWKVYAPLISPNIILFFFVAYIVDKLHPETYSTIGLVILSSLLVYLGCFIIFSMSGKERLYVAQTIKTKFA